MLSEFQLKHELLAEFAEFAVFFRLAAGRRWLRHSARPQNLEKVGESELEEMT